MSDFDDGVTREWRLHIKCNDLGEVIFNTVAIVVLFAIYVVTDYPSKRLAFMFTMIFMARVLIAVVCVQERVVTPKGDER